MSYQPLVGSDPKVIRSGAVGNSYNAAATTIRTQNWNQAILTFNVTLGSATDVRVQIDMASPAPVAVSTTVGVVGDVEPGFSDASWFTLGYQDNASATSAGGVTSVGFNLLELVFTASGTYVYPLALNYKWLRVRAKCTGNTTNCTLTVNATTGMA